MDERDEVYFPLVRDVEWGVRLNTADLAVNKLLAAASRTKARDYVDLITIDARYAPLGPLVLGASGKPPNFSPQKIIDEIRRRSMSLPAEDYMSVRGLPADMTIERLRGELATVLDRAEVYIHAVAPGLVGLLPVDGSGRPVEAYDEKAEGVVIRRATAEPETVPTPGDQAPSFD